MKLIIGLGNPGEKYKNNRHNVGYMVADYSKRVKVFKTNTFMNDSGSFVSSQLKKTDIDFSKLYIIHDDLDIKLGEYKIQFGKGPKVHNGLNDIYDNLHFEDKNKITENFLSMIEWDTPKTEKTLKTLMEKRFQK